MRTDGQKHGKRSPVVGSDLVHVRTQRSNKMCETLSWKDSRRQGRGRTGHLPAYGSLPLVANNTRAPCTHVTNEDSKVLFR